jgi:hypothetical protein
MATFDPRSGRIALDERFRDAGSAEPGVRIDGSPHGAVFSNPATPTKPSK